MRLAFMGTPDFSVKALEALVAAGHEIACVYTQPPRRAGRGKRVQPSAVHAAADTLGLPVETPDRFRDPAVLAHFGSLDIDIAVVVAYGQILPQAALDTPRHGCLNIHASLLPRWRGAAPIHRAIMAGDQETGVGIMQMEAGLDTGPVLLEARTPITDQTTTPQLHDTLAAMGARLIVEALDQLDHLTPQPQPEAGITYAHKIDKAEGLIDWAQPTASIDRMVRALQPFPGAFCTLEGERCKILSGKMVAGKMVDTVKQGAEPGLVLDAVDGLVATGDTAYRIERIQRAGKGAMDWADFQRGYGIKTGARFAGVEPTSGQKDQA